MNKLCLVLIICVTTFVCCHKYPGDVRSALDRSGDNRQELESILDHFAKCDDPRKLSAAEFLIANMPGHGTYKGIHLDQHIDFVKNNYPDLPDYYRGVIHSIPFNYPSLVKDLVWEEDLDCIKADYLIRHIEEKFRLWDTAPWGDDISFDVFCNYLLPYRCDREPLNNNNDSLRKGYTDLLLTLRERLNVDHLSLFCFGKYVMDYLIPDVGYPKNFQFPAPIGRYETDCIATAYGSDYRFKAVGIPSAIDYAPQWADHNNRHYWNIIIDPEIRHRAINENTVHRAAKIYRKTYAHNTYPNDKVNFVPELFRTPFLRDVTDEYLHVADVNIKLDVRRGDNPQYAYLSVFDIMGWQPLAWSKVKRGKGYFPKIGVNAVYQPVYYRGEEQVSAGYPFLMTADKKVKTLIPDEQYLVKLSLERKYPLSVDKLQSTESLIGCRIEASDSPDFKNAELICKITSPSYKYSYQLENSNKKTYRYWRLCAPGMVIAEFTLLDSLGFKQEGKPISALINRYPEKYIKDILKKKKSDAYVVDMEEMNRMVSAFDNNPLTFTMVTDWIGYDMGHPVKINKIVCIPRNDENYIYPGNVYELFYMDAGGWVSLGKKKADDFQVEFDNVPQGGLYWLRNLTKGKEERIFTADGDKIVFW